MSEIWLQQFADHDENLASTSSLTSSMLSSDFKHVNNFMENLEKNYLSDAVAPTYPSLLLSQENGFISESDVAEDVGRLAPMLPHKKRIPRKLKSISMTDEKEFQCEICGHYAVSQLDFFSHLKEHYEPISSDMLGAIEPKKHDLEQANMCYFEINEINNDSDIKTLNSASLESGIGFENFQNEMKFENNDRNNDIKVFNANTIEKCTQVELEFSDTDDTELENTIRNVVDKVAIEDSCDEIDLIASNGALRDQWFTSSNYTGIATSPLKADCNFVQILEDLPAEPECQQSNLKIPSILDINDTHEVNEGIDPFCSIKQRDKDKTYLESYLIEDTTSCEAMSLQNSETGNELDLQDHKEKKFFCKECCREFNSGNALKYHIKASHTKVRPHHCDICGRSFFAKGALNSHKRIHTGDKPFQCSIPNCAQKFRQWGDLKYHMTSIHSDEKNHQCEFCGKSFSRKYSLVLHIRIHENEKNYKCEFCNKAFRASSYLQNHRKIHTGEKPHECKVCGKRFRVFGDLRRHFRIHQRDDSANNIDVLKTKENIEVNYKIEEAKNEILIM